MVVESFDLKEAKTKAFREALTGLKFKKTALVVEAARTRIANLELTRATLPGWRCCTVPRFIPITCFAMTARLLPVRRWKSCRAR